jgi:hypothetical protein
LAYTTNDDIDEPATEDFDSPNFDLLSTDDTVLRDALSFLALHFISIESKFADMTQVVFRNTR